jgi:septal ring factor EnvC (AmiA/AmiB activator)
MKRFLKIFFALTVWLCAASGAYAQNTKVQEEKKAKLEREIAIIDKQLAENASRSNAMLSNLTLIRKKVANRKAMVAESDRQIRKISDNIYLKQRQINRLQARVDTLTNHYSRLIVSAYKNRDSRIWYMYMLASDNLGQAFRRYSYFKNLSSQMNDEARKIKAAQEELLKEKEELSKMKKEAQAVKNERVKELDKLRAEEKEVDKVVKNLQRNKTTYQKQLAAKKKQINALNKEIERILAAAVKQSSSSSSSKKSAPVDYKLAEEFSKNKGKLPWPADGPVVGRFGKQFHPVFKNLELPPNNGVDIATSKSAGVQAVFKGVVKQVFVMPGYNQCVLISHGNYFTFYCKLKTVNVKAGDKVSTGETIGKVDTINGETQLHFEVWQNTKPQNPETWLR